MLAAFAGMWVGHTLEYLRSGGTRGLAQALLGSIHLYMLPLGLGLAVGAALLGGHCWRAWVALRVAVAETPARLLAALRDGAPTAPRPRPTPARPALLLPAWLGLAAAQLALYLVQENLERRLAGLPLPGLSPLTGEHAPALLIHLGLALVSASALTLVARRFARAEVVLEACERLIESVLRRRRPALLDPREEVSPRPDPLRIFGRQLCRRPPPAPLSTAAA